jgi:uncharacterized protein (DUF885 family)
MVDELAEAFWEDYLGSHPLTATLLGFREHDAGMPDVSPGGRRALRGRLAGFLERAQGLDSPALEPAARDTRSALIAELEGQIAELDADLESWTLDPLAGPQVTLLQLPALQTIDTPERARDLAARYRAIGPYLDAHAANLERSLADGKVAPASAAERVDEQLAELLARPLETWELLVPARRARERWPDGEGEALAAALEAAVRDVVAPAFERYARAVRDRVLPRARPGDRAGLDALPGGEEAYRKLIRVHTSLDVGPEEAHAFGHEALETIRDGLRELGGRALGTVDLATILSRLRGDPELYFQNREEIETTARRALERARQALPEVLGRLPRSACEVRRIEPFEEAHSTIAYYRNPAADGSRPGTYYVNTSAPETRPRYEAEALAYHESIPGHHVQIALSQEREDLPQFRRHLGVTAFVEGWGLYAELLAEEMGLYGADLDRIGRLSFDAWRASRLVVDTGLHALGWSRQRAIDFMLANTALGRNNIVNEVDRYIVWPGQALAYKIGQREILRLRDEARQRRGASFDGRAFHDELLAHGAPGLPLIRERIEAWLEVVS